MFLYEVKRKMNFTAPFKINGTSLENSYLHWLHLLNIIIAALIKGTSRIDFFKTQIGARMWVDQIRIAVLGEGELDNSFHAFFSN